jgi:hypothetical protein
VVNEDVLGHVVASSLGRGRRRRSIRL